MSHKAAITITYCSQCNWMLRASWMAQELLHSFSTDIASVTLNVYYEYIFFGRNRRWRANVLRGKKRPLAA